MRLAQIKHFISLDDRAHQDLSQSSSINQRSSIDQRDLDFRRLNFMKNGFQNQFFRKN